MDKEQSGNSKAFTVFLLATAFLCGAMIMVIEVLGARVVSPFFGISLFVWTSIITVTLVALAAGYALGGFLSDRLQKPGVLYGIIMAAGVCVMLIPALRVPVLTSSLPLGLRAGSFVSALVLFGPSLLLLGCVSPYLVRLAAREMKNLGRTVGYFYALSTVGSFFGTVVTGFYLITFFGVGVIFKFVGVVLLGIGIVYFAAFRKKYVVFAALAALLLPVDFEMRTELVSPGGAGVRVVHSRESHYGNLKVVDYDLGSYQTRELAIDGLVQGGVDLNSGLSIYSYNYLLQFLPRSLRPGGTDCLVIGLGAGIVPPWYDRLGVTTDVVDIDRDIVNIAEKYFGYTLAETTTVADARYYLVSREKLYDYMILDVFSGDTTPGHLLSLEAFELMKKRMKPGGIMAANLMADLGEDNFIAASLYKTMKQVFKNVTYYPTFDPAGKLSFGNLVVVASDGPTVTGNREFLRSQPVHPLALPEVRTALDSDYVFAGRKDAIVLSDDYNPIDFYDLPLKEHIRTLIIRNTNPEVLL